MAAAVHAFPERIAPTLQTIGGVGLGPLLPEDASAIFHWTNDLEANALDLAYRPMDGVTFSNFLASLPGDPTRMMLVIRVAPRADAVGFVIFSNISTVHRSADISMRIGRAADRGRGIGTAATTLALSHAWRHINLERVQLKVLADNRRAVRAYEKAGFAVEGRHAHAAFVDGRWHDMLTMAALNPATVAAEP